MHEASALRALGFPSAQLKATAAVKLRLCEELTAKADGLPPARLAADLLHSLVSLLQRVDVEVMTEMGGGGGGTSCRTAGGIAACRALYRSLLGAITSLAGTPALGAALEQECFQASDVAAGRMGIVHATLEKLFAQMMSCGPRFMGQGDPDDLLDPPRCGLWAAAKALLRAAPNSALLALLALTSPRGSCLLVPSMRLTRDDRHMQAAANAVLGAALEFLATQAPLLVGQLRPEVVAPPFNSRLADLTVEGQPVWREMWAPVRRGLTTLAVELLRAGGPRLYAVWRAALPKYRRSQRPPLLGAMNDEWARLVDAGRQGQEPPLESELHRMLVKCGQQDTEAAGLVELHDFMVAHPALVSLFCAQSGGDTTPYGHMVNGYMRAAAYARGSSPSTPRSAHASPPRDATLAPAGWPAAAQPAAAARPSARAPADSYSPPGGVPLSPLSPNVVLGKEASIKAGSPADAGAAGSGGALCGSSASDSRLPTPGGIHLPVDRQSPASRLRQPSGRQGN